MGRGDTPQRDNESTFFLLLFFFLPPPTLRRSLLIVHFPLFSPGVGRGGERESFSFPLSLSLFPPFPCISISVFGQPLFVSAAEEEKGGGLPAPFLNLRREKKERKRRKEARGRREKGRRGGPPTCFFLFPSPFFSGALLFSSNSFFSVLASGIRTKPGFDASATLGKKTPTFFFFGIIGALSCVLAFRDYFLPFASRCDDASASSSLLCIR